MPIRYEWTPEQKQQAEAANQWIMEALSKVMPGSAYMGSEQYQPIAQPIANALAPATLEEAMQGAFNSIGVGPLEIMPNYRNPVAIQELRRIMAQEQRARGPLGKQLGRNAGDLNVAYPDMVAKASRYEAGEIPDPADLILRGSWFHGMSEHAREIYRQPGFQGTTNDPAFGDHFLRQANEMGLPGSTHATPSFTRFGEPYGISLSASPSVSAKFSPDQNIHRVMPLYEGPPTERTLQLWKPEHQKRFNEAYNEAINKWLVDSDINPVMLEHLKYRLDRNMPIETGNLMNDIIGVSSSKETGQFNTMFSDALKSQGVRGLLYNPRRYGEYEMLMLDPQWALPLDYRPSLDYSSAKSMRKNWAASSDIKNDLTSRELQITPKALQGYISADPEFAANHARLSDMFGLMPWSERINQENWQKILSQVDPAYQEAIINQLFGNR